MSSLNEIPRRYTGIDLNARRFRKQQQQQHTNNNTIMAPSAQSTSANSKSFSMLPKVINGGIAGIVGVTCVFPIDLCKTRLQNQKVGPNGEKMYSGLIDCFRKSYAAGGFRGMYSGSAVNILLITPEKAIKLVANDFFRHKLKTANGHLPLWREMLAGGSAGFCQIIVTTPMELLKIQLQSSGPSGGKKQSATSIALNLFRTKGIAGLYKGTLATMSRDVTFSVVYFPLFAHLNKAGPRRADGSGEAVFYHSLLSGILAGGFASFFVNPIDVIKTRLQTLSQSESQVAYNGVVDAFTLEFIYRGTTRILREEGVQAFYKGAGCRMIVIAPLFGIAQTVYFIGVAEWLLGYNKKQNLGT